MTSNTRARLASGRWADGAEGDELVLAQAIERRLARPLLADDPAQDRAGDDDRAEHRDEDADDQDEGEAADDRRAEGVQDRCRVEARHVRVEDGVPRPVE